MTTEINQMGGITGSIGFEAGEELRREDWILVECQAQDHERKYICNPAGSNMPAWAWIGLDYDEDGLKALTISEDEEPILNEWFPNGYFLLE